MGLKAWLIRKLEDEVEYSAGHIELEDLTEEEREKMFKQFGEGDSNLTNFLKEAYNKGLASIFCCSGHGVHSAYVTLKITDENIELARKIGRILSKQKIVTNFTNNHVRGKYVDYRSINSASTEWLRIATDILKNPELFEDVEPDIYYHEMMQNSRKPFGFDFKKRLLSYLRGTKQIDKSATTVTSKVENKDKEKGSIVIEQAYKSKEKLESAEEKKSLEELLAEKQDEYQILLKKYNPDVIHKVFEILQFRKRNMGQYDKNQLLDKDVQEIFDLMDMYAREIKELFIENNGLLTHITSVSPRNLIDGKILKSKNRLNNYETEVGDWVFASSTPVDGNNPYIARCGDGMIRLGTIAYIYGGNHISVQEDESGKKHAILDNPNYVYKINPENFVPVVTMKRNKRGEAYFEFSREWISKQDVDINDRKQVLGVDVISNIDSLLEHYHVLCDVDKKGIGIDIRNSKTFDEALIKLKRYIENGEIKYINGEVGINANKELMNTDKQKDGNEMELEI